MLSTNRQSLRWWPPSSTSLMSGLERICWAKGSMARAKRIGDRGHPCLVPRCMGKGSDLYSAHLIWAVGKVYKEDIQAKKCSPKPQHQSTQTVSRARIGCQMYVH